MTKGYYFISYLMQDRRFEPGERVYIQIGDEISSLSAPKNTFEPTEPIQFLFENGPGTPKNYVGIYNEGDVYGIDELVHWLYVDGQTSGSVIWENHQLPVGNYFAYLFTNDSYDAVSNRVEFSVTDSSTTSINQHFLSKQINIYQEPLSNKITVINNTQKARCITIYNLNGYLLETIHVAAESTCENTVALQPGIYVTCIDATDGFEMRKLIIK